jgi:hypothetical protein
MTLEIGENKSRKSIRTCFFVMIVSSIARSLINDASCLSSRSFCPMTFTRQFHCELSGFRAFIRARLQVRLAIRAIS